MLMGRLLEKQFLNFICWLRRNASAGVISDMSAYFLLFGLSLKDNSTVQNPFCHFRILVVLILTAVNLNTGGAFQHGALTSFPLWGF